MEDVLKELKDELLYRQAFRLDRLLSMLESPIEQALVLAMLVRGFEHEQVPAAFLGKHITNVPKCGFYYGLRCGLAWVVPQVSVQVEKDTFRVDLALSAASTQGTDPMAPPVFVAIECDGHDFHERTKEQAQRDKARDRALQSIGWRIARFTGSEIYKSPETVVCELAKFVTSIGGSATFPTYDSVADFLPILQEAAREKALEEKSKRRR